MHPWPGSWLGFRLPQLANSAQLLPGYNSELKPYHFYLTVVCSNLAISLSRSLQQAFQNTRANPYYYYYYTRSCGQYSSCSAGARVQTMMPSARVLKAPGRMLPVSDRQSHVILTKTVPPSQMANQNKMPALENVYRLLKDPNDLPK